MTEIPRYSALIEVWHECNYRCRHCYLPQPNPDGEKMMTLDTFKQILDILADNEFIHILMTGYEPLLNPHIFDFIAEAKKLHFDVRMKSNGWLIDAAMAQKLADAGVSMVDISIYSTDATEHDAITLMEGSHKRAVAALHELKRVGRKISIGAPILHPMPNLLKLKQFAESLEAPIILSPNIFESFDHRNEVLNTRLTDDELVEFIEFMVDNDPLYRGGLCRTLPKDSICGIGDTRGVSINWRGEFQACSLMPPEDAFIDKSLERRFKEWGDNRQKIIEKRECNSCEYLLYCSPCPAQALLETGDLYGCRPEKLRYAKLRKKVNDRLIKR